MTLAIPNLMDSKRQQKFSRLIQKDLSDILQKDKYGIRGGDFVTVADVEISADLAIAKIYLSMMLVSEKESLLQRINERKPEIRKLLGNKIGKQVRKVPELIFYIDEVEEQAARIEEILKNLDIPPETPKD